MNDNGQIGASLILAQKFEKRGKRLTSQRLLVYDVIASFSNHPTAEEVFARAREKMSSISLATVYNCLEVLGGCDVIRSVRFGVQGARYCISGKLHAHLHMPDGSIADVPLSEENAQYIRALVPQNYNVSDFELNFKGSLKNKQ
jgi:Fur family transcriptional regulator, peroxide stress response regulator